MLASSRLLALFAVFACVGAVACSSSATPNDLDDLPMPDREARDTPPKEDTGTEIPGEPIPGCEDTCPEEGERRCKEGAAGSFEACLRAQNGCLAWMESACAAGDTCDPTSPAQCFGQCPPAGAQACEQVGTKRCTGEKLEECVVEGGCPIWREAKDCGAENKICDGNACVTQCTSTCTTAGAKRCVAGTNNYETCKEVQPGCLKWQSATSCGSGKVCEGAGSCVCNHQCTTVGTDQCVSPTTFRTCTTNAAGCRVWTAQKNCARSLPSPGCFAYGKACFGKCADQCTTEGQITCTGSTSYVKCTRNSEQCLVSTSGTCKTSLICFASPSTCANGG